MKRTVSSSLAAAVALAFLPQADASDPATLNRLGGVYGGNYSLTYEQVQPDGTPVDVEGVSETAGGRVVVPKRESKRFRGILSFGLGQLRLNQRVKKIRCRANSATYRGRLTLTGNGEDNDDDFLFVGSFRARTNIRGEGERLVMRFAVSGPFETSEPDGSGGLRVDTATILGVFRAERK